MFVTHLESAMDGTRFEPGRVWTTHQGRPLWVRYDLEAVRRAVQPAHFADRVNSLWRYRELLPLPADVSPVTLGEGMSPLLPCPRLGAELGMSCLIVKDESQLPTGSFKSRGMTTAVSMAQHLGLKRLAIPTAGNAGGALAAYAARAGMEVFVFMPDDTPAINQIEAALCGARVFLVNGLISDCGKIVREGVDKTGWFDFSTLKEPYRLEGKKTMGLELAEQLGGYLPDVILYPTGGGTGLIGMWKAFAELTDLGWLAAPKLPKLVSCQSDGCAPIVRAFEAGQRFAEPFARPPSCRGCGVWLGARASRSVPRPRSVSTCWSNCAATAACAPTTWWSCSTRGRRKNTPRYYRSTCRASTRTARSTTPPLRRRTGCQPVPAARQDRLAACPTVRLPERRLRLPRAW